MSRGWLKKAKNLNSEGLFGVLFGIGHWQKISNKKNCNRYTSFYTTIENNNCYKNQSKKNTTALYVVWWFNVIHEEKSQIKNRNKNNRSIQILKAILT